MFKDKAGQSAAGAAVLLVIIAGLLIMFIILVPPAERAKLLGENSSSGKDIGTSISGVNLLSVSPGKIDYLAQKEIEHPLPVINIYTRDEAKVIAEKAIVYSKKSLFSGKTETFNFSIADLSNTNNILLNFKVKNAKGRLKIVLNGEQLYDSELTNFKPISIPKNMLGAENEMILSVSSPGLAFWSTNEIYLENFQLVADVVNLEAQTSKNIFLVSETEKKNLEATTLRFQPTCNYGEAGKLKIGINGNEIYNGLPDCDVEMIPLEFSPGLLYQGENKVVFSADSGTYILSHVMIRSKLKEVDYPTYYFQLSNEQYNAVTDARLRLRVQMDFVDVVVSKYGELVFNGHLKSFDTKEVSYALDLSEDVVVGNNALKILPKKTLELRQLKVDLVK